MKGHMVMMAFILLFTISSAAITIFSESASMTHKLVSLCAVIVATYLLLQRNTYLPFLGSMALPPTVVRDDVAPMDANVDVTLPIDGNDGEKVVYWASNPSDEIIANPWKAYGDYQNAGVAAIANGEVKMRFACPSRYNVPYGHMLRRHVHFRKQQGRSGMFGPVETVYVTC